MLIKALSLWQPWASLLAAGVKRIETRGWPTGHRGLLLIHAGKHRSDVGYGVWHSTQAYKMPAVAETRFSDLPFGAIVGAVDVTACRASVDLLEADDLSKLELDLGDYRPDRYGFVCEQPVLFVKPIPWRGMQGMFNVEIDPQVLIDAGLTAGRLEGLGAGLDRFLDRPRRPLEQRM